MGETVQGWNPASALVTGASSGIGAALAIALATPGRTLHLGGRDESRLASVAERCRERGAAVDATTVDVRDRPALRRWIAGAAPDLLVANAGISGRGDAPDRSAELVEVNVTAVIESVEAALPAMLGRGHGQLALMSSLAGYRGMPSAPVYCATKAAVRVYGDGLRAKLARDGIAVSVICPGFVATPMTAPNPFPMPLLMSPERAAGIILRGLARRRAHIAFPLRLRWAAGLLALLPPWASDPLLGRVPSKE
ncbi:MAG: SDR family NAD(P)-dependent oxidoreductase [Geminicoccaceae bacterium]